MQQILQRSDMIFVSVSCNTTDDAVFALEQPCEVWNYHIDVIAVFGFRKHQPAIDQQNLLVLFNRHAVSTDFAEPTEKGDANRF